MLLAHLFSRTDDPLDEKPSQIFFNGSIDDLAIYDRILTTSEISYLYELRRGREQTPRLEALVDAIGTVEINEGGAGYRENPDLVFWYGQNDENESNLQAFDSIDDVNDFYHDVNGDFNGTEGVLVYVNGLVDDAEEVYTIITMGKRETVPTIGLRMTLIMDGEGWYLPVDWWSTKMLLLEMWFGPKTRHPLRGANARRTPGLA